MSFLDSTDSNGDSNLMHIVDTLANAGATAYAASQQPSGSPYASPYGPTPYGMTPYSVGSPSSSSNNLLLLIVFALVAVFAFTKLK